MNEEPLLDCIMCDHCLYDDEFYCDKGVSSFPDRCEQYDDKLENEK